jgi:DNA-binding HxlR family transcriptional regulator
MAPLCGTSIGDHLEDAGGQASLGELIKRLGSGASGPILMTLKEGPRRTQSLTDQIPKYAPRTVYRYLERLSKLGLVDRQEEAGVPTTVVHHLSRRSGREMVRLLSAHLDLMGESAGWRNPDTWTTLGLLGELWEAGWIEDLSRGSHTPTELAERTADLSFHQVNRRMRMLRAKGLLEEHPSRARGRRYLLAPRARQGMALIVGLARWRENYLWDGPAASLTVPEMGTVLRVLLPLIKLPEHPGKRLKLGVVGRANNAESTATELVTGEVGLDGSAFIEADNSLRASAWALGTINTWSAVILNGNRGRLRVGGDLALVDDGLTRLYDALWQPEAQPPVLV